VNVRAVLLALACSALLHGHAMAQSLVLSGGGARGLAHAGAIVALEELGYEFDVVAGTSMGAIIGALYAAGYDAHEIRDIIARENWLERFAAQPVVLGAQRVPRRPQLSFGLGDGRVHEGIVATTGVNQRLLELLFDAGVHAGNDFDALPRRYRAVATDLSTGAEVVLDRGDLPRAVRASMAVPGAFAPVRWLDGRVLVDGGIINNLPVSAARALSDEPVVAIDVLQPSPDVIERSAAALGVRAIRLLIANAMRDTVPADVLVLPRIGESLNESRFPADAAPLIRAGYGAVMAQAPRAQPTERRVLTMTTDMRPARIDTIVIDTDRATARLVRRMMWGVTGAYDAERIVARTGSLYATDLFDGVWPRVEVHDGTSSLIIDVTKAAATSISAGAGWDNDVGANGWAMLRQRLTLLTPWELRAVVQLDPLDIRGSGELAIHSTALPGVTWTLGAEAADTRVRLFTGDSVRGHATVQRRSAWAGAELHAPLRDWFVSTLLRAQRGEGLESAGPFVRIARAPQPERVTGLDPLLELERGFGDSFTRMHVRTSFPLDVGRLRSAVLADVRLHRGAAAADLLPATTSQLAPWLPHGSLRSRQMAVAGADVAWPTVLDGYVRVQARAVKAQGFEVKTGAAIGAVWPTVAGSLHAGVAWGTGSRGARLNLSLNSGR